MQTGRDAGFGSVVVRQTAGGGTLPPRSSPGGTPGKPLPRDGFATEGVHPVFARFVVSGFGHSIPKGLDHILFVLGLIFFSLRLSPLLWQVATFTLVHTVTLALTSLQIISIPASIVEPLIVHVAVENIIGPRGGNAGWGRVAVVFGFGLLHGLDFAAVRSDVGLPEGRFVVALVGFNIEVEPGQLAVTAAAFVAFALPFGRRDWDRRAIAVPAAMAIAAVGAWWTCERVFL
jgi:hypothetical protein